MRAICFIIWMILSVVLVFSLIGLVLFMPKDNWQNQENTPSTWCTIGRKLLDSVINKD